MILVKLMLPQIQSLIMNNINQTINEFSSSISIYMCPPPQNKKKKEKIVNVSPSFVISKRYHEKEVNNNTMTIMR